MPELYYPPYSNDNKRYRELCKIGEGAFGEVSVGIDQHLGRFVAIKNIRLLNLSKDGIPKAALREMRALQLLEHENIIRLLDVFPKGSSLSLVLEYMSSDLEQVLRQSQSLLPESHVKSFTWMLLKGVAFLHSNSIIHRDIKPSNLLISSRGVLKIGDMGLARVHNQPQMESYSHQVATRWYRAPELLFGARRYGFAMDLWAVGAVYGELMSLSPLFPGNNDVDQLFKVFQILGTPSSENWPTVHDLPDYNKVVFPEMSHMDLDQAFPRLSHEGVGFITRFLTLDPSRRITAQEAMAHPYFFTSPLPLDPSLLPIMKRPLPGQGGGPKQHTLTAEDSSDDDI